MTTAMRLTRRGRVVVGALVLTVLVGLWLACGVALEAALPPCATMFDDGTVVGCE